MKKLKGLKTGLQSLIMLLCLLPPCIVFGWEIHYEDYVKYSAPTWTPDGKIAFIKSVSNSKKYVYGEEDKNVSGIFMLWHQTESLSLNTYLCTMNIDGTEKREVIKIATKNGVKLGPEYLSWSNKNKVLISATGKIDAGGMEHSGILLIDLNKKKEKMISETGRYASFSPAGEKIVYADNGLWLIDTDGKNKSQLTDNPGNIHPLWSPDGKMVAFSRSKEKGKNEIVIYNLSKATIKVATQNVGFECWDNINNELWVSIKSWQSKSNYNYYVDRVKVDINGSTREKLPSIRALERIYSLDRKYIIGQYEGDKYYISSNEGDILKTITTYQAINYGKRNRKENNNIWIKE